MHGDNAKQNRQARIAAKKNIKASAAAKIRRNAPIFGVKRKTTAMAHPTIRTDDGVKTNQKTLSRRKTNPGANNCWNALVICSVIPLVISLVMMF